MEQDDIKIPTWITNISLFLGVFYINYKKEGFFKALKTMFLMIKTQFYVYLYNHNSWFRNYVLNKIRKINPELEIPFDVIFSMGHLSIEELYDRYPNLKEYAEQNTAE